MQSNCPNCGYELQDMLRALKQDPNVGNEALDLFNEIMDTIAARAAIFTAQKS